MVRYQLKPKCKNTLSIGATGKAKVITLELENIYSQTLNPIISPMAENGKVVFDAIYISPK